MLVTGDDLEKLLAVLKINKGTDKEQSGASENVLEEWELKRSSTSQI